VIFPPLVFPGLSIFVYFCLFVCLSPSVCVCYLVCLFFLLFLCYIYVCLFLCYINVCLFYCRSDCPTVWLVACLSFRLSNCSLWHQQRMLCVSACFSAQICLSNQTFRKTFFLTSNEIEIIKKITLCNVTT